MKGIEFNSIADFKRKAEIGRFIKGRYYNFAKGERVKNDWREIIVKQTNSVKLKTDGVPQGSWFDFPKARDCEIEQISDGSVLKIFEDRIKYDGGDVPASASWINNRIKQGQIQESEIKRYRKQVAEYKLGAQS